MKRFTIVVALVIGPAVRFSMVFALLFVSTDSLSQPGLPSTAWGAPDLRGIWNHGTATSLERPDRYADREFLTDAEVAVVNAEAHSTEGVGARRAVWWERGLSDGRTALIVEPPTGRIPYTTEVLARARQEARADGPGDLNLSARCLTQGVPRLGGPYSQNIHLFQTPSHIVLLYEMIHEFRVIPLDGRPHLGPQIRQWLGDSRGRWEGDTLVVETTNFSNSQLFRGFSLGATRLVERFLRDGAETLRYTATFEDPTLWTQPWTAMLSMPKTDGPMFEFACHEGNYGMTSILEIARAEETVRVSPR